MQSKSALLDWTQAYVAKCILLLQEIWIMCINIFKNSKKQCSLHLVPLPQQSIIIHWSCAKIIPPNPILPALLFSLQIRFLSWRWTSMLPLLNFKISPYMIHHESSKKEVFTIILLKWGLKIMLPLFFPTLHCSKVATFSSTKLQTHFQSLCEITRNSSALLQSNAEWDGVQWVLWGSCLKFISPYTWAPTHIQL